MDEQRQENNNLDDSAVLQSITSQWWSFTSFVPLVTGALWLWLAANGGLPAVLLGAVPGALLLGTGLSGLLWAVESRTFQYMALASVLGGVLSLPAIFIIGPVAALVLALGSAASFFATGYLALGQHRCPASVPAPDTESTPRREGRSKRADDMRPHPHELARRGGNHRRPCPARGYRGIFPVR